MAGQGKTTFVLTRAGEEPELMAKLCTSIFINIEELLVDLRQLEGEITI
jgi:hypothetical protein